MNINFSLWLFILVLASGLISLLDMMVFSRYREKGVKAPFMADYARSLFVVFLVVFLIRSFLIEPYRIPSGSMLPTLKINDFVLVNKFSYGVHWPLNNGLILKTGEPKRGDVVVFEYPVQPDVNFIKRVIGLPGDMLSYVNKNLYVNGKKVPMKYLRSVDDPENSTTEASLLYQEDLPSTPKSVIHQLYLMKHDPFNVNFYNVKVPKGMYFMMGDNRDESDDSRFWGFVPQKDLVGKAFFIWMSWDSIKDRIRFSHLGFISS